MDMNIILGLMLPVLLIYGIGLVIDFIVQRKINNG